MSEFAVIGVHTFDEKVMFTRLMTEEYSNCNGLPDFVAFAIEWNLKANGETMFYKHQSTLKSGITTKKSKNRHERHTLSTTPSLSRFREEWSQVASKQKQRKQMLWIHRSQE